MAVSYSDANKTTMVPLPGGTALPIFGLGTFLSQPGEVPSAVKHALSSEGYLMVDTASMYGNEAEIGGALAELKLNRDKYYVVTKLLPDDHGFEQTIAACDVSLKKLGLDYVDLYLIHNPKGKNCVETWKGMLECKAKGKAKAVGVSNFGVEQLKALKATGLATPEVNQVELHPWHQQPDLTAYHAAQGIVTMGYCPLARCKQFGSTAMKGIAESVGKTEAQVCIRWCIQKGYITIPKSVSNDRIKQNGDAASAFTLTDEQMGEIAKLDTGFKASGSVNDQDLAWGDVQ